MNDIKSITLFVTRGFTRSAAPGNPEPLLTTNRMAPGSSSYDQRPFIKVFVKPGFKRI